MHVVFVNNMEVKVAESAFHHVNIMAFTRCIERLEGGVCAAAALYIVMWLKQSSKENLTLDYIIMAHLMWIQLSS